MSRNTTAARRIALLASSSLGLAAIASAASLSVALTPTKAHAANECGDPLANGPAADEFICPTGPYPGGIDYSTTSGDLTLILQDRVDTGTSNTAGTGPLIMYGDTGADMTLLRDDTAPTIGDPRIVNTAGVGIDMSTQGDGDVFIDLTDGDPESGAEEGSRQGVQVRGGTHGIRAVASGAGDVTFVAAATGPTGALSGDHRTAFIGGGALAGSGGAGLYARTQSGDITIDGGGALFAAGTTNGGSGVDAVSVSGDININGSANGRLYGIYAQTGGAGTITIAGGASAGSATSVAALYARAETGLINVSGSYSSLISGNNGSVILAEAGGDVQMNLTNVTMGGGSGQSGINLATVAGSASTIDVTGTWGATSENYSYRLLRLEGEGDVAVTASGLMRGGVSLADHSGEFSLTLADGGRWNVGLDSVFAAGDDTVVVSEGALFVATTATRSTFGGGPTTRVLDFGAGSDVMRNRGVMVIGPLYFNTARPDRSSHEFEFRIEGLETFENAGRILLGGDDGDVFTEATDGWYDDILSLPGARFVGLAGSEIVMDVNFGGTGQTACDPALRNEDGDMPAADCVAIIGGSTEGVTYLAINDMFPSDRGGYSPEGVVLVDVSGGESAGGHFVISPNSSLYSSANGGSVDKGMFFYTIAYDAENQQHKLLGLPGASAYQFPALAQAAHSLWRTSTAGWLNRQADLRGNFDGETGGGVWGRISTEFVDRGLAQSTTAAGNTFDFDNSYKQDSYAVTGGFDILSASDGRSALVAGLMLGYANAEMEYDVSPNASQLDGFTGGAYASWLSGGLFIDAAVNANRLILKQDVPGLGLLPEGTILDTNLISVGAQVEAGYRLPLMAGAFVEPLAGLTYVRSKYDDLTISNSDAARPGIDVEFDDPTSLRASVGARLGMDRDYGAWRGQMSLLGRVWEEFEDETAVILHSTGPDALLVDSFGGTFTEFGVGIGVYGLDDALSGFFNFGGQFGDDYESQNLSAGVRVNW